MPSDVKFFFTHKSSLNCSLNLKVQAYTSAEHCINLAILYPHFSACLLLCYNSNRFSIKVHLKVSAHRATDSSLSKNWASTMETSSMMRCWQLVQCCSTLGLWASSMHCCRGADPEPIPGGVAQQIGSVEVKGGCKHASTPLLKLFAHRLFKQFNDARH